MERDLHRVLAAPETVNHQVREIEREQQAQELREGERERSRGMSMGRDVTVRHVGDGAFSLGSAPVLWLVLPERLFAKKRLRCNNPRSSIYGAE
jgi:hypothetical protein